MKKVKTVIGTLFLLFLVSQSLKAQSIPIDSVTITRDSEDKNIKELEKGEELYASHSIPFGGAKKLREKAIDKLKVEAAQKGYAFVLILKDEFSNSPINNVNIVAVGYRKNDE